MAFRGGPPQPGLMMGGNGPRQHRMPIIGRPGSGMGPNFPGPMGSGPGPGQRGPGPGPGPMGPGQGPIGPGHMGPSTGPIGPGPGPIGPGPGQIQRGHGQGPMRPIGQGTGPVGNLGQGCIGQGPGQIRQGSRTIGHGPGPGQPLSGSHGGMMGPNIGSMGPMINQGPSQGMHLAQNQPQMQGPTRARQVSSPSMAGGRPSGPSGHLGPPVSQGMHSPMSQGPMNSGVLNHRPPFSGPPDQVNHPPPNMGPNMRGPPSQNPNQRGPTGPPRGLPPQVMQQGLPGPRLVNGPPPSGGPSMRQQDGPPISGPPPTMGPPAFGGLPGPLRSPPPHSFPQQGPPQHGPPTMGPPQQGPPTHGHSPHQGHGPTSIGPPLHVPPPVGPPPQRQGPPQPENNQQWVVRPLMDVPMGPPGPGGLSGPRPGGPLNMGGNLSGPPMSGPPPPHTNHSYHNKGLQMNSRSPGPSYLPFSDVGLGSSPQQSVFRDQDERRQYPNDVDFRQEYRNQAYSGGSMDHSDRRMSDREPYDDRHPREARPRRSRSREQSSLRSPEGRRHSEGRPSRLVGNREISRELGRRNELNDDRDRARERKPRARSEAEREKIRHTPYLSERDRKLGQREREGRSPRSRSGSQRSSPVRRQRTPDYGERTREVDRDTVVAGSQDSTDLNSSQGSSVVEAGLTGEPQRRRRRTRESPRAVDRTTSRERVRERDPEKLKEYLTDLSTESKENDVAPAEGTKKPQPSTGERSDRKKKKREKKKDSKKPLAAKPNCPHGAAAKAKVEKSDEDHPRSPPAWEDMSEENKFKVLSSLLEHEKSPHASDKEEEKEEEESPLVPAWIRCSPADLYFNQDRETNNMIATKKMEDLEAKFESDLLMRAAKVRETKPAYEKPVRINPALTKHGHKHHHHHNEAESSGSSSDDDSDIDNEVAHGWMEELNRKQQHPERLHDELWFNEPGEMNDGPLCRCSLKSREGGIRHDVYPGESPIPRCDRSSNNKDKLYHYRITMSPHTNFLTKNPTIVEHDNHEYIFEGFSLLSHYKLENVPVCRVIRFNIEYTIHWFEEDLPENFTLRSLDLFTEYLFFEFLELVDLDWKPHGTSCSRFHLLPRFVRDLPDNGKEVLSMNEVLLYLLRSSRPLIEESDLDELLNFEKHEWQTWVDKVRGMIVTYPGMRPSSIRIDQLDREHQKDEDEKYPMIIHFGIRPAQLSYAGDPNYQKLWKQYVKFKHLLANKPKITLEDKNKLERKEEQLQEMRMKSSMKREVTVELTSKGFTKTGIKSDVCQHAMLLPVLIVHLRFHKCLDVLEANISYKFKDRMLLQLALTHPSYRVNFGTNPDHARNSLSNCGIRQPEYGDRRIHHVHTRKRGINTLINIMSRLGRKEETQSEINHYERLEFLGDAVVEFMSSIHLYYMFPSLEEGGLATYRAAIVQNQHLAVLAKKLRLHDYMLYAHGPDLCHESDLRHAMANCLEALMGALFLDGGIELSDRIFGEVLFDDDADLLFTWQNIPVHPLQEDEPNGDRHWISSSPALQKLLNFEEATGIEFTHVRLLARAFTMRNVGYNNLTFGHNQRLEFLGDTVLQLVASEYLFKHFPEHHEGHLSLLRSSLVNNRTQAVVCDDLGMTEYIIHADNRPYDQMGMKHKEKADLLEAYIGGLYVDKDLEYCTVFCHVCFFPRLKQFILNQDWNDPKSQLQQCSLTLRELDGGEPDIPIYKVIASTGPTNTRRYTVAVYFRGERLATGSGHSIQQAEMNAATNALADRGELFPQLAHQKRFIEKKYRRRRRRSRRESERSRRDEPKSDSKPSEKDTDSKERSVPTKEKTTRGKEKTVSIKKKLTSDTGKLTSSMQRATKERSLARKEKPSVGRERPPLERGRPQPSRERPPQNRGKPMSDRGRTQREGRRLDKSRVPFDDRDRAPLERERPSSDRNRPQPDRERHLPDRERPQPDRDRPHTDRNRPPPDRDRPLPDRERPSADRNRPLMDRTRSVPDRDRRINDRESLAYDRQRPVINRDRTLPNRDRPSSNRDRSPLDRARPAHERQRPMHTRDRADMERPATIRERERPDRERPQSNRQALQPAGPPSDRGPIGVQITTDGERGQFQRDKPPSDL